jgi:3-oxoacyl-[acyl-carrier-protein] synthase-1
LSAFEERERLLTSQHSDGFIPGEAAAAVLVEPLRRDSSQPRLICSGIGFGVEKATEDSGLPLRADGLVAAIKAALADAGCDMGDLDYRITDISGGQYGFKEASLALNRILRKRKEEFDILHPADCVGEVGAASGPVVLAVTLTAMNNGYAPGLNALCHFGNEEGKRAAAVLNYRTEHAI